jgi:hypothetical protein
MTFTHALSTNNYGTAKFIVATSAANGTHTTLTSALAAASSGDTVFLRDSVTENVTLPAGVNIAAWNGGTLNTPAITGTVTMTAAGTCNISGIELITNSAALVAVTGSAASILNLYNCYINCSNNTGITYSSSSSSSKINCFYCRGNIGTTGIAYFTHTSAGNLTFYGCNLENSGSSTTNSTISSGTVTINNTTSNNSITTSSTGTVSVYNSNLYSINNNTALTLGGTNSATCLYSQFTGGTASAVSIGSGCSFNATQCDINSTNTNAVTGAGTSALIGCTFTNTSKLNNTTTQTISGCASGLQAAPSAGMIGEQIRSFQTSPQSVSNNTAMNITSISVTPGVWDISAVGVLAGTITGTVSRISISATSATNGSEGDNQVSFPTSPTTAADVCLTIPSFRVTLTATTTYYLVGFALFTVGTMTAIGRISATRVG